MGRENLRGKEKRKTKKLKSKTKALHLQYPEDF